MGFAYENKKFRNSGIILLKARGFYNRFPKNRLDPL